MLCIFLFYNNTLKIYGALNQLPLKGPFKKYVIRLEGKGLTKMMKKCDKGGRGLSQRVMSLLQKNVVSEIVFLSIEAFYSHHFIDILM